MGGSFKAGGRRKESSTQCPIFSSFLKGGNVMMMMMCARIAVGGGVSCSTMDEEVHASSAVEYESVELGGDLAQ